MHWVRIPAIIPPKIPGTSFTGGPWVGFRSRCAKDQQDIGIQKQHKKWLKPPSSWRIDGQILIFTTSFFGGAIFLFPYLKSFFLGAKFSKAETNWLSPVLTLNVFDRPPLSLYIPLYQTKNKAKGEDGALVSSWLVIEHFFIETPLEGNTTWTCNMEPQTIMVLISHSSSSRRRLKHLPRLHVKLSGGDAWISQFKNTPPKTNMEPKNWWFVDVSPFPMGYFQVPCLF